MEGLNRVQVIGNLGADPELRYTQGGQAVLNMRVAATENYLDKEKVRQERTEWFSITVWGARGEALAKFLTKGMTVFVEGGLRTTSYENKEGQKVYKTEVNATDIKVFGGGKGKPASDEAATARQRSNGKAAPSDEQVDDSIPF